MTLTADWDFTPLLTGALNYGGFSAEDTAQALSDVRQRGDDAALIDLFDTQVPLLLIGAQVDDVVVGRRAVAGLTPLPHAPYGDPAQWGASA